MYIQMVGDNDRAQSRPALCPACRGTGVVRPKDGPLSSDVGVFCVDCKDGQDRWQATLKSIAEYEKPGLVRTPVRERQTRVFV